MWKLSKKFIAILLFFAACARVDAAEKMRPVWLVGNGFHTSLAFRVRDFPASAAWSGDRDADHLLIGWGAADFYRGRTDLWTICRSIGWPTPSALHVVPVRGAVARRFLHSDVIRLQLPSENARRFFAALDASFARDKDGRRRLLGPGYFLRSRFYAGREHFCFFKMCNVWFAQKLRRSGVPINPLTSITAAELARQVAKVGHREHTRSKPLDAF